MARINGRGLIGDWEKEVSVVSRVNFLQAAPERIEDVARVVRDIVNPGIRDFK